MNESNGCVFDRITSCSAIVCRSCKNCVFYKTKSKLEKDRATALTRIRSLPNTLQSYIAEKYYAGRVL